MAGGVLKPEKQIDDTISFRQIGKIFPDILSVSHSATTPCPPSSFGNGLPYQQSPPPPFQTLHTNVNKISYNNIHDNTICMFDLYVFILNSKFYYNMSVPIYYTKTQYNDTIENHTILLYVRTTQGTKI